MRTTIIAAAAVSMLIIGTAGAAHADDSLFLTLIHDKYFSHSFSEAQLLAEGHKICDSARKVGDQSLYDMAASDLGISDQAGAQFVITAHVGLGC